jgi:ABC-type nitrate/sulfonate/bicarbonate transport system substrate-binding protein
MLLVTLALSSCASPSAPAAQGDLARITIAEQGTAGTTVGLLAHVADKKGFFAQNGIKAEKFVAVTKGSDALSGLMSDAVQVFHGADGMIAASNGGAVVGIGSLIDRSIWTLVANPEVKKWADLEDKVLALSSTSDITRVVFDRSAGANVKLDAVDYAALGAPSQRVAAVTNGQAAATFTTYPSAQTAINSGLNNLGFSADGVEIAPIVATEIVASKAWTTKHPEQAEAYMKAMIQALNFIKDKSNSQAVAELVSELNKEPVDSVLKALDTYFLNPPHTTGYYPSNFHHLEGAFDSTVDAYRELGLLKNDISEGEYMNYSFVDAALGK